MQFNTAQFNAHQFNFDVFNYLKYVEETVLSADARMVLVIVAFLESTAPEDVLLNFPQLHKEEVVTSADAFDKLLSLLKSESITSADEILNSIAVLKTEEVTAEDGLETEWDAIRGFSESVSIDWKDITKDVMQVISNRLKLNAWRQATNDHKSTHWKDHKTGSGRT